MSQRPPSGCGRITPRWSTASGLPCASEQPPGSPPLTAGLDEDGAIVCVAPPLSCSAPRPGVELITSPWLVKAQELAASSARLCPAESNADPALRPQLAVPAVPLVFEATIESVLVTTVPAPLELV
jgi:hypothetical protein